ncbi:phosphopantetheine-binding protein, partial [Fibrella aquatilis]
GGGAVGRESDFFRSGGDSIKAIQIASRLYQQGYRLDIKTIFQYPVLHEQAQQLTPLGQLLPQALVTGHLPLTPIQQAYFALPDRPPQVFNQLLLMEASHGLDAAGAQALATSLLAHHDGLRLCFPPSATAGAVGYVAAVAGG